MLLCNKQLLYLLTILPFFNGIEPIKQLHMRPAVFLLLASLLMATSQAQDIRYIKACIKDSRSLSAIEGANIQVKGSSVGTISDSSGIFSIRTSSKNILIISHISYHKKEIGTDSFLGSKPEIFLNPKTISLKAAEISSKNGQTYKHNDTDIKDYCFLGKNILTLNHSSWNNSYSLIYMNEVFDTLALRMVSLQKKPKNLFTDCTGQCHLIGKDSVYQIFAKNNQLYFIYPTQKERFMQYFKDCLFETVNYIAMEGLTDKSGKIEYASTSSSDMPQVLSNNEQWKHFFYAVHKKSKDIKILDYSYEWKKIHDAYAYALYLESDPENKLWFGDLLRFEEMTSCKPSLQKMVLLGDSIYYFNHLQSSIDILSREMINERSIEVEYHLDKNWHPIILTDRESLRAFTIFKDKSTFSLYEINLINGSINALLPLSDVFPAKLKVNNDHLYYLFKSAHNSFDYWKLHQERIPARTSLETL